LLSPPNDLVPKGGGVIRGLGENSPLVRSRDRSGMRICLLCRRAAKANTVVGGDPVSKGLKEYVELDVSHAESDLAFKDAQYEIPAPFFTSPRPTGASGGIIASIGYGSRTSGPS
jgi:hypothetical protein